MDIQGMSKLFKPLIKKWHCRNTTQLMGLDISPDFIKLLKINTNEIPHVIEHFSMIPLPKGAIVKNEIKQSVEISTILKELSKQAESKTKNIALAIPRSSVIIKTILIDNRLSSSEIESRAWIEANRLFPELVGEIYIDFQLTGISPEDPTQLELVLVACRKDQINPYLDLVRQSGLVAKIVDVDSYAFERALSAITQQYSQLGQIQTIALLNIDHTLSSLLVIHDQNLIYAHDQSFDGYRLMAKVQDYLGGKKTQPEQTSASLDDPLYTDILSENLSTHLRHAMHFLYSSRPNVNIQQLIIAGDCALVPNIALFIQHEIGIETILANPFAHMKIAPSVPEAKLKKQAPALMLCCGLALSQFNNETLVVKPE